MLHLCYTKTLQLDVSYKMVEKTELADMVKFYKD